MTLDGDIVIQPLRSDDHPHWLPLWKDYQAFYAVDIPPPVTALTWTRLLDPAEPAAGALAWQGAVAVGLVHHIRHRSCWTAGDYCYLQDLFVAPAARKSGVGRKLIEHVYALAARDGYARVYWLTHETNSVAAASRRTVREMFAWDPSKISAYKRPATSRWSRSGGRRIIFSTSR
jgi:GNAT superfamily N-acetyltransferase